MIFDPLRILKGTSGNARISNAVGFIDIRSVEDTESMPRDGMRLQEHEVSLIFDPLRILKDRLHLTLPLTEKTFH